MTRDGRAGPVKAGPEPLHPDLTTPSTGWQGWSIDRLVVRLEAVHELDPSDPDVLASDRALHEMLAAAERDVPGFEA